MYCGQLDAVNGAKPLFARKKIRALLVDDSPFMVEGISQLLRRIENVELRGVAMDGLEGVNLALATRPDLVLMDFQMPKMDGLTAARLIRETQPEAKIILITAHDLEAVRKTGLASHVDGILSKQHLPSRLRKTLRELFADRFVDRNGKETLE